MTDLFPSAKRSLRRGQYHVGDLAARLNDMNPAGGGTKQFATFVAEADPDGVHEIQKLRFHPHFRDEFPSIIFDAVSNFRACLDQMTYAASVPGGLPDEDFAYFPICKDVSFIDDRINGLKYLPPEVRALFRSFEPYKGGNNTLWALSELCNLKKHSALVPIDLDHASFALIVTSPEGRTRNVSGPLPMSSAFDAEKNEIEIVRVRKGDKPKAKTEVSFAVILRHSDKAISGQHPIFLLDQIRAMVERILTETEALCLKIGLTPKK